MTKQRASSLPCIETAEQAIDLARQAIARHRGFSWESACIAQRQDGDLHGNWMVHYQPVSASVRGASGTVEINCESGLVTFIDAQR